MPLSAVFRALYVASSNVYDAGTGDDRRSRESLSSRKMFSCYCS